MRPPAVHPIPEIDPQHYIDLHGVSLESLAVDKDVVVSFETTTIRWNVIALKEGIGLILDNLRVRNIHVEVFIG